MTSAEVSWSSSCKKDATNWHSSCCRGPYGLASSLPSSSSASSCKIGGRLGCRVGAPWGPMGGSGSLGRRCASFCQRGYVHFETPPESKDLSQGRAQGQSSCGVFRSHGARSLAVQSGATESGLFGARTARTRITYYLAEGPRRGRQRAHQGAKDKGRFFSPSALLDCLQPGFSVRWGSEMTRHDMSPSENACRRQSLQLGLCRIPRPSIRQGLRQAREPRVVMNTLPGTPTRICRNSENQALGRSSASDRGKAQRREPPFWLLGACGAPPRRAHAARTRSASPRVLERRWSQCEVGAMIACGRATYIGQEDWAQRVLSFLVVALQRQSPGASVFLESTGSSCRESLLQRRNSKGRTGARFLRDTLRLHKETLVFGLRPNGLGALGAMTRVR